MKIFNKISAFFPKQEKGRDKLPHVVEEKSMVEQEQPVLVLTPKGIQVIKKAHFNHRLEREHQRARRLNEKALVFYKKSVAHLRQAAAIQAGYKTYDMRDGFNAKAKTNRLDSSTKLKTLTKKETKTMTTENQHLPAEKQHYVSTISHKKRLYQAHKQLQNTVSYALNSSSTSPEMMKMAQEINAASQNVQSAANYLHRQQKAIEEKNPELKTEAIEYSKSREQTQLTQKFAAPQQSL